MLEKIIDLHLHSKYSRACSPALELPNIASSCEEKGIDIASTGDFTHPAWFRHIEDNLEEIGKSGLYKLKEVPTSPSPSSPRLELGTKAGRRGNKTRFIFGTEISCIYKHKEKVRRLHLLIFAPNIETAGKFNNELEKRGVNLKSDGRPIMGLSGYEIVKIASAIDERMMVIPAHAWTPWFAVFGSKSGYDSLEECFEELTPNIFAVETGPSSDPTMNHRLSQLDKITLISNSDAHSLDNLGREANVMVFDDEADINYGEVRRVIKEGDRKKFLYTIEFYPEEGKYHYDGHKDCKVNLSPKETKQEKFICPKCKKVVTVGVLHRVDDLADREDKDIPEEKFIPHKYIVPLREIIGGVFEVGKKSKKVEQEYRRLITKVGNEFYILLRASFEEISRHASDPNLVLAIQNMREGKVKIIPGYDGVYGIVDVLPDKKPGGPKQSRLL